MERSIRDLMCDAKRRGSELVQFESQLTTMGRITQDLQARFQEADAARQSGAQRPAACCAATVEERVWERLHVSWWAVRFFQDAKGNRIAPSSLA